ncbi:hypothetical protein [Trichlorobacter lovleyi]|uniref:Uncharacterized protein n=1 Tax=Trichlorobacter lovleyi (strain ATCC BAA-1151 / DSM 17278 / SZ) TaxID=398767 RepID=B3EA76_TRIL1|nr:hypothetical protein [Trichlorobacter lovleyi]ACD93904.1 hypothetical protein Glov_0170 [Trichlorobacter lovleyi SZ]
MRSKTMKPLNDEFAGMDAALRRAAKVAQTLARKTKTPCYVWKDGQIVDITAVRRDRKTTSDKASLASTKK